MAESFSNDNSSSNGTNQCDSLNHEEEDAVAHLDIIDHCGLNDNSSESVSPIRDDKNGLLPVDLLCSGLDEHRVLHQVPPEVIPSSVREKIKFTQFRNEGSQQCLQTTESTIEEKFSSVYPLHWHVWHNDLQQLSALLAKNLVSILCLRFCTESWTIF